MGLLNKMTEDVVFICHRSFAEADLDGPSLFSFFLIEGILVIIFFSRFVFNWVLGGLLLQALGTGTGHKKRRRRHYSFWVGYWRKV
jgi:hypothetical protein